MAHGSKVPDFRLQLGDGAGIVVEVKQFDPNPEEQEAAQGRGSGVLGGKPGHRLRQVISKANNQLKVLGQSDPGMLVVYNRLQRGNSSGSRRHRSAGPEGAALARRWQRLVSTMSCRKRRPIMQPWVDCTVPEQVGCTTGNTIKSEA